MHPMLARTIGPKFDKFPCFVQPKLNGVRALYQQDDLPNNRPAMFQSRDEKLWFPGVLAHLLHELDTIRIGDTILDGELYVHGWKLQTIIGAVAVNRKEPRYDTHLVEFHVFDVVDPYRPFSSRWSDLFTPLQQAALPHVRIVPTGLVQSFDEMIARFRYYGSLGYEGLMARPDGPYEFGEHLARHGQNMTTYRSKFLWKHKHWEDGEFVCVGVIQGEGKADIGVGALVCAGHPEDYKNISIEELGKYRTFKVGTGLDDSERIEFMQNPPIGRPVKVRYLCLTADGIPFNPSFLAVL